MDISNLTVDCIFVVFSHFSYVELVRVCLVCHEWNDIAKTGYLWKELCTQEFRLTSSTNYEQYFKHKLNQEYNWTKSKYTTKQHCVHKHSVRGVSFSPKIPHLLASSGYDSTVHILNVLDFPTPFKTFTRDDAMYSDDFDQWQRFSRVKWTCDGEYLVATNSTLGKASTRPDKTYADSSSIRLDRTALATHPRFPYLVACAGNDSVFRYGGNISLIDTRVPNAPVRIMQGLHKNTVRDIEWVGDDELLTASPDGTAKITNLEGNTHTTVAVSYHANENTAYEGILSATKLGNTIALGCSGCIEIWNIAQGAPPVLQENLEIYNDNLPVWRLKYNNRGTLLYAADDDGYMRVFHRKKTNSVYNHILLPNVLKHSADVSDVDISIDEAYVASASQSREVGLAFVSNSTERESEIASEGANEGEGGTEGEEEGNGDGKGENDAEFSDVEC